MSRPRSRSDQQTRLTPAGSPTAATTAAVAGHTAGALVNLDGQRFVQLGSSEAPLARLSMWLCGCAELTVGSHRLRAPDPDFVLDRPDRVGAVHLADHCDRSGPGLTDRVQSAESRMRVCA
jgi:hypothetical protein